MKTLAKAFGQKNDIDLFGCTTSRNNMQPLSEPYQSYFHDSRDILSWKTLTPNTTISPQSRRYSMISGMQHYGKKRGNQMHHFSAIP